MATTLSLLAVFLPVGFMGGIVGRFMSSFGFTSAFAIAVSLLVSFTLTPMLCSRFIKPPKHAAGEHSSKESVIFQFLDTHYTSMLKWSMAHRKTVVAISAGMIVAIVPLFTFVGKNFLPQDDQSQYNVLIRTPEGTSLAATTNVAERIAQDIRALPGVQHTLMTAGGSADKSVNNASIYVKLTDIDQRQVSQLQLMQRTRDLMKKYPQEIHTGVELVSTVGGNQSNADVQYYIQGPDLDKLAQYSDKLLAKMNTIPGPGRYRYHAAQRQAGSAAGDRPAARRRPGRLRDGYRTGAEHPGGRPGGVHVQRRATINTTCACAPRSSSAAAPKGWRR